MLEVITKPNSLWVADFCFLTRRFMYSNIASTYYHPEATPEKHGAWHQRGIKQDRPYVPKWARYALDFSQFNKWDRLDKKPIMRIPIYDRPIVLFAIQDVASRYIIHACLRQAPKEMRNKPYQFPHWFNLEPCFKEALQNLPHPSNYLHFALDYVIHHNYSKKILASNWISTFPVKDESKFLASTLEAFFGRLQYEMRTSLTLKNLDAYIQFWNNQRTMQALKGKTPSSVYFTDYY